MFQTVVSILGSAYAEIVILVVLLILLFRHRKDTRLIVSGVRMVRTILLVIIFFYFVLLWSSEVNPTLRDVSLFGLFVINLYMLYNLLQAGFERPYRKALAAIVTDPENHELIHDVWRYGKRFYYSSYVLESLISGENPRQFLRTIATDRVRDDIKGILRRLGVEKELISLQVLVGYLRSRMACDVNLPVDFKDVIEKAIDDFAKHPWIEEQTKEFLHIATESPEDLHFSEWVANFEKCLKAYKK